MTSTTAPVSLPASGGRAIAAFTRTARAQLRRAGVAVARSAGEANRRASAMVARRGAAAVGVAGLGSIAYGAGQVYTPAGWIVGGALAVWFASRLPRGET